MIASPICTPATVNVPLPPAGIVTDDAPSATEALRSSSTMNCAASLAGLRVAVTVAVAPTLTESGDGCSTSVVFSYDCTVDVTTSPPSDAGMVTSMRPDAGAVNAVTWNDVLVMPAVIGTVAGTENASGRDDFTTSVTSAASGRPN